jgi:hypothetical protein
LPLKGIKPLPTLKNRPDFDYGDRFWLAACLSRATQAQTEAGATFYLCNCVTANGKKEK